jgi:hypothetical protein
MEGKLNMNQAFDPTPQTAQPPLSDRTLELQRVQAMAAELTRRMKNGANNFYWIAALSVINSLVIEFGGDIYFVVGLASTLIVDTLFVEIAKGATDVSLVVKLIGLVISIVIAGIFALFGLFASRGKNWAFIVGMVLYLLDTLLMLAFQEWMGLIFHGFFLFGLFGGWRALSELNKLAPPKATDFPQNIGVS